MHNKLTCLFGYHDYSDKLTEDKDGDNVYLCKICKRSAHFEWDESEAWFEYDEEGNCLYEKWSDGMESWRDYDEEGNVTHIKWDDGEEQWKDNDGHWVKKKPKNWKYEKCITN